MAQQADILAKKDYVDDNYQPRLVAGTGISINPSTNVITSTGGGSLVTYAGNPNISQGDSLGVLTINGTSNVIMSPGLIPGTNVTITTDISTGAKTIAATGGTTVTPNPQGTPSGVLTSIGIGNTIYSLQGGAYYGTTDPDSSLGIDGDIYIKYTSGTPDTINAMFVKINDEWIEAELGGGAGSTPALDDLENVELTTPTDGQALTYDATNNIWINDDVSGGTTVIANPQDSATDTLETIKIGETIYDIAGSGSGGQIDILYSAETTTPPQIIMLENALTDYDYIITHIKSSTSGQATIGYIYTVESMTTGDIIGGELAAGSGWIWYTYTNATSLTYLGANNNYYITEITGLKIGGGGGSYSETELFVNTTPTTIPPASITLDDDFTNYDILYFDIIRGADGRAYHIGKEILVSSIAVGDSFQFLIYSSEYFSFTITDSTTFTRLNYGGDYLYKIIGIKH